MTTVTLHGCIGTTDPLIPLGVEVWLDQTLILDLAHVTGDTEFSHEFDDDSGDHSFRVVLKNKQPEHTKVDEQGNITQDAVLVVKDLAFDDVALGQLVTDKAVYTHDRNGTGPQVQDKFYGEMGCNGTLSLAFTSPFYIWLLENM